MCSNSYNHVLCFAILFQTLVTLHYHHTKPVQINISPLENEQYCYLTACDVLRKFEEKIPLFFDNQTQYSSPSVTSSEDYEMNNINFKDTQETRLIKLERRLRSVEQTGTSRT